MTKSILQVLLVCFLVNMTTAANILGVFPFPSKSHCILGSSLMKGLANRGHNVTLLTAYKMEDPSANYRELVMDAKLTENIYANTITRSHWYIPSIAMAFKAYAAISVVMFEDRTMQALINSDDKYDVIIYSHIMQLSLLGLSHKFHASTVLFHVLGVNNIVTHTMGSPHPAAYVPNMYSTFGEVMTYWQRTQNLFFNIVGSLHLTYVNEPSEQTLLTEYFPAAPSLKELVENIRIVLINSHISLEPVRPILQNMIHIGGFYMDNLKPLSKKVQMFLDSSKRGVLYFSFGTNVKYHHLSKTNVQKYLKAFELLPFNILWKLDTHLPGIPSNVMIVPWVEQLSVLAHQNVKVFITHGGKGGLNEAIYYGVPLLVLPCYADQIMNARATVKAEFGLELNFHDFTVDEIIASIKELTGNSKFKQNIMQRSYLLRNQKVHPMDEAEYWIDYVAKNPNATFLQSMATKMPWYKVIMLDVLIVYFSLFIVLMLCIYWSISRLFKNILNKKVKVKDA